MAEVEQASLKSEQLSDKSSSPALPDDLSLDEHTAFQLLALEDQVRFRSTDSIYVYWHKGKMGIEKSDFAVCTPSCYHISH